MTHELGPASRALLDAARDGLAPDAAAITRMRANIDASVAGGAVGATGAGAVAVKLGVVAVVAAIAVGALIYRGRGRDQPAPPPELSGARVDEATATHAHETAPRASPVPEQIEMAPMPARAVEPARVAQRSDPAGAPARPSTDGGAAQPLARPLVRPGLEGGAEQPLARTGRPSTDLAREVELVDQAMAALRRGDARAALAAVRRHAAETAGAGQLAEDAAAIEIEARCRLHDPTTAAELEAFDARWPQSAQRSRLASTCR